MRGPRSRFPARKKGEPSANSNKLVLHCNLWQLFEYIALVCECASASATEIIATTTTRLLYWRRNIDAGQSLSTNSHSKAFEGRKERKLRASACNCKLAAELTMDFTAYIDDVDDDEYVPLGNRARLSLSSAIKSP